jgi:CRP/FNR family transcriptional regulator, anaerobic regulatory protein
LLVYLFRVPYDLFPLKMKEYYHLFTNLESTLIAEIEAKGRVQKVEAGTILLKSGQPIRSTMIVLEGLVKLYREGEDGGDFLMYYLHPGDGCALSLICDRTFRASSVTVKAVKDTVLVIIPIEETENWMRQHRTWYHFVVDTYRKRYEELLLTIDSIAFRNMDERLEFYLRRHRDSIQSNILKISNTEIAQELNSSREVISRLMKKLAESGKVRLLKTGIEIVNL